MWQLHWSVGAVAASFKMAAMNFQCPISRRIIIFVSLSLISGPQNTNYGKCIGLLQVLITRRVSYC